MDPRVDRAACHRLGARSIIAVPLLDHGKAVGILEVFSGTAHAFDDNDIRHLNLLAKMTVEAMAQSGLHMRGRLRHSATLSAG
jgi:GAF domain-containing protein